MYLVRIDDGTKVRQELVESLDGLYKTPKERGLLNCVVGHIKICPNDAYCRVVMSHDSTKKSGYDISARYSFDILSTWFRFEYDYSYSTRKKVMDSLSGGGWTCESIDEIYVDELDIETTCIKCGLPKVFYNGKNPLNLPQCRCKGFDFLGLRKQIEESLSKADNNVLVNIARTLHVLCL